MKAWLMRLVWGVATLLTGVSGLVAPVMAVDVDSILDGSTSVCDDPAISDDLKEAAGCTIAEDKTAIPVVIGLIRLALSVVGIAAVAVIIYGAITYVTSLGDAAKVYRAKNIILYGVVGLVVALLAFTVITYVSQSIWGGAEE